nr:MAG TPA: hypothetical protein [Caudoviricetes sp.]
MIKRVATIRNYAKVIANEINDFISKELNENEYIIDIKYMEDGRRLSGKTYGIDYEIVVVAIVHIGELNNETR